MPKVEQGLMDAERRGDMLREMNEKLAEANKLYEGLLEDRVRESERRSSFRVAHQGNPNFSLLFFYIKQERIDSDSRAFFFW